MEQPLKQRTDVHLARKIWHFSGVMLIAGIYSQVSRTLALQLISFFTFLCIVIDLVRHQWPPANRVMMAIFRPVMREHEKNRIAGISYLLLGSFIIILLFPKSIVLLSLLFLGVADPLASYVGIRYGQDKILGNKSLQGSLAAFFACTFIAAVYYFAQNIMTERLLMVSLLSGLIGAFSELIPIWRLDDNLTFPLVSSSLLWILFFVFGGFPF